MPVRLFLLGMIVQWAHIVWLVGGMLGKGHWIAQSMGAEKLC